MSFSTLLESIKRRFIPLDYGYLFSAALRRTGLKYSGDHSYEEALSASAMDDFFQKWNPDLALNKPP